MSPINNEKLLAAAVQDENLARPGGNPVIDLPPGAWVRDLPVIPDDRGILCELFDPRWEGLGPPFAYSYLFTIRPGVVKGWSMHLEHCDRYCLTLGEMTTVLYDGREDSPTFGRVFEVFLSEVRRRMLLIPPGVWHADINRGDKDVLAVNFPTRLYDHQRPDKYRLPIYTDLIPYRIPDGMRGS